MNYIEIDTGFERWCENNYLPKVGYVIWKQLFKRFNRSGWREWVTVDNRTLMADCQIEHTNTFTRNRDKLIECGLIEFTKGKKGMPNNYKLLTDVFYSAENSAIIAPYMEPNTEPQKYSAIIAPQTELQTEPQTALYTELQTAPLNKNINKTKTKQEMKESVAASPPATARKKRATGQPRQTAKHFAQPSLDEVRDYCAERNNAIDPQLFYDFYTESGWIDSRGQPVRNWKQKIITWEGRGQNNGQPGQFGAPSYSPTPVYTRKKTVAERNAQILADELTHLEAANNEVIYDTIGDLVVHAISGG